MAEFDRRSFIRASVVVGAALAANGMLLRADGPPAPGGSRPAVAFPIRASEDRRYLVDAKGRPFFYHADTAWNLPKKLTLAEAEAYFDDRKARSFTAVQLQAVSKPEYRDRRPVRPIILGESGYEEEVFFDRARGGTPHRIRRQAYRAVLSGALGGHAFGNRRIWRVQPDWREALGSPATRQMAHVKALFTSRAWFRLVPDAGSETLVGGHGEGDEERAVAARR